MKKVAALILVGAVLLTAALYFPARSTAHEVGGCYGDHLKCRENAFNLDTTWYKMMLALTVCDIMLGKCLLTV